MGLDAIIFFGIMGPFLTVLGIKLLDPQARNRPSLARFLDTAVAWSLGDPSSERSRKFAAWRVLGLGILFDLFVVIAIAHTVFSIS